MQCNSNYYIKWILIKRDQDIFAEGLANGRFTGWGPTNQCQAYGAGCVEAACLPSAEE